MNSRVLPDGKKGITLYFFWRDKLYFLSAKKKAIITFLSMEKQTQKGWRLSLCVCVVCVREGQKGKEEEKAKKIWWLFSSTTVGERERERIEIKEYLR